MDRVGEKIVLLTGGGHGIGRSTAELLANEGARVNSLPPAYIDTRMADYGAETLGTTKEELDAMHPIGHMGEPEDVAYAVLYLASDESTFMTGSEMVLDGGLTAQ